MRLLVSRRIPRDQQHGRHAPDHRELRHTPAIWEWQTGENMDTRLNDTTHIVYPHSQIVLEEGAELCGKYYKPDDYRFEDNDLQFWGKWIQHIYANTTLVEYSYWNPEKWTFKSKRRLRKYELIFDKHE